MPQRNGYRSRRGRSAIARKAINTNSTNGMMPQLACTTSTGEVIQPCRYFGGPVKGGAAPSATGFMVSRPWKIATPALNQNYLFKMRYLNPYIY